VFGRVVDNVYRAVADVKVEVIDGAGVAAAAMTDASGDYQLPGVFSGTIAVRASRAGFVSQTQTVTLHPTSPARYQLGFILDRPSESLAGSYAVTISADPACSDLPPAVRSRTYEAIATPSGASNGYRLELSGARFYQNRDTLIALVSGNSVRFDIDPYSDLVIVEELTPSTALTVWGISGIETIGPRLSVFLEGEIDYCPDAGGSQATFPYVRCLVAPVQCGSSRHTISLLRQ